MKIVVYEDTLQVENCDKKSVKLALVQVGQGLFIISEVESTYSLAAADRD